jgi:hypothetical protein
MASSGVGVEDNDDVLAVDSYVHWVGVEDGDNVLAVDNCVLQAGVKDGSTLRG